MLAAGAPRRRGWWGTGAHEFYVRCVDYPNGNVQEVAESVACSNMERAGVGLAIWELLTN